MNATGGAAGFDGASLDQNMLDSLPEGQVDKPDIRICPGAKMAAESASDTDVNHQIAVVDTPTEGVGKKRCGYGGQRIRRRHENRAVPLSPGDDHLRIDDHGRVSPPAVRRLTASPRRMVLMGLQRLLTLGGFALVVCVGYLVLSIGLMMAAGLDPLHPERRGC